MPGPMPLQDSWWQPRHMCTSICQHFCSSNSDASWIPGESWYYQLRNSVTFSYSFVISLVSHQDLPIVTYKGVPFNVKSLFVDSVLLDVFGELGTINYHHKCRILKAEAPDQPFPSWPACSRNSRTPTWGCQLSPLQSTLSWRRICYSKLSGSFWDE